ncbi:MAG: Clp protease ClpP [Synergistaceae bacterium]|nr:Clp protease ClpP [Synergistaceae bacterium]
MRRRDKRGIRYLSLCEFPCSKQTVYIDGICASAASIIAMCGNKIIMPSNALMMIHNPWGYCEGDSEDMQKTAESLDRIRESCAGIYELRTGLPHNEILAMMKAETWMNGHEAKAKGFVDEVSGEVHDKVSDAYMAGVRDERKRLQELDELMSSEREEIITRAKYETFATASAIAVDLVKSMKDSRKRLSDMKFDSWECRDVSAKMPSRDEVESGVKMMNRMRGYA